MPFKKVGTNDYTGPTGKHFDLNQVRLYYANGGAFPGQSRQAAGKFAGDGSHLRRKEAASVRQDTLPRKRKRS
jgi:hypothetical protein